MKDLSKHFKIHENKYSYLNLTTKNIILLTYHMKQWPGWVACLFSYLSSEAVMFALSNRSFRNAGLAFYGLGSLASLGMISDQANAQTLANNTAAASEQSSACSRFELYSDPYIQCRVREWDRSIEQKEREVAALRRETARTRAETTVIKANAQRETACQDILIKGIEAGKILPERVSAIYGRGAVGSVPACKVLEQLSKG